MSDYLEREKLEAEEELFSAFRKLADAYMRLAADREESGEHQVASMFYYEAGTNYHNGCADDATIQLADEGYRRCKDVLPRRFKMVKP